MLFSLLSMIVTTGGWYDVGPYLSDMYDMGYVECSSIMTDGNVCARQGLFMNVFSYSDNVARSNNIPFTIYHGMIGMDYFLCKLPTKSYFDLVTMEHIDL